MIDLAGKRAFVTGGGRGIGHATAVLLARAGAKVAVGYRSRKPTPAAHITASVRGDLGTALGAKKAVAEALRALDGSLDILVINHGVWPADDVPVAKMTDEQWESTRRANLDAVIYVTRAAIPKLHDGGTIVLVASTAGQRGEAFHADYAATKGAVIALTKSLAVELAPKITVNCVAPGWVDTEMSAKPYAGEGRAAIEKTIPLRRVASAEDIAGPILFLCSPLARHITGEILNVNGGSVLCG
jgi:3-oxoacyl-[acyl-carrier protein] reductase